MPFETCPKCHAGEAREGCDICNGLGGLSYENVPVPKRKEKIRDGFAYYLIVEDQVVDFEYRFVNLHQQIDHWLSLAPQRRWAGDWRSVPFCEGLWVRPTTTDEPVRVWYERIPPEETAELSRLSGAPIDDQNPVIDRIVARAQNAWDYLTDTYPTEYLRMPRP